MSFKDNDDVVMIDSASEDERSPPKQRRGQRGRRGRGRKNSQTSTRAQVRPKSSRQASRRAAQINSMISQEEDIIVLNDGELENEPLCNAMETLGSVPVIDGDSTNCVNEGDKTRVTLTDNDNAGLESDCQAFTSRYQPHTQENSRFQDACNGDTLTSASSSVAGPSTEKDMNVQLISQGDSKGSISSTQPVKARRGLAKKNSAVLTSMDSVSSTTSAHNTRVYSEQVAQNMKNLLFGVIDLQQVSDCTSKVISASTSQKPVSSNAVSADDGGDSSSARLCEKPETRTSPLRGDLSDDDITPHDTPLKIRSPTPPPEISKPRKAKGMNRTLKSALKTLSAAKVSLAQITPPRRGRRQRESDVEITGEEEAKTEVTVKIRYLATVHRITMKFACVILLDSAAHCGYQYSTQSQKISLSKGTGPTDPFHTLTHKLSQAIGEPEHLLSLYLHDEALVLSESPQSVGLTVADIIECHSIKPGEEGQCPADTITLVIQCRGKRTRTNITANKRSPLEDIMYKYAQMSGQDVDSLTFHFDGETISPQDTPLKLDMEDDDVIDVLS